MAVSTQEVIVVNPASTSVVTVTGTAVGPQGIPGPSGIFLSATAPTDKTLVWADPNDVTYTTLVDGGSA